MLSEAELAKAEGQNQLEQVQDQSTENKGKINKKILCNCTDTGYNGEHCELDVNECEFDQSCKNGGVCTNEIGTFKCNCTDTGFKGERCEIEIRKYLIAVIHVLHRQN